MRRDNEPQSYLTDRELSRWIEEAESSPLLGSPSYLKREILEQTIYAAPQGAVPAGKVSASRRGKRALWLYSLKVSACCAAALAILFLSKETTADLADQLSRQSTAAVNILSSSSQKAAQRLKEWDMYFGRQLISEDES